MTSVCFAVEFESRVGALLQIMEKASGDQVVARFIPFGEEHVTIHRTDGGALLKTHYWPAKPEQSWDQTRVAAARSLDYAKPERHSNYSVHAPLNDPPLFPLGDHLIGRLVEFGDLSRKSKYLNDAAVVPLSQAPFFCQLYFSRDRATEPPDEKESLLFEHQTSLGWLYVTESEPKKLDDESSNKS